MNLANVYAIYFAALNLAAAQLFVFGTLGVNIGPWRPERY